MEKSILYRDQDPIYRLRWFAICFINYFYCLVFSQLSVFPFVLNPITFTLIFLPLIKVSLDSSSFLNVC